MIDNLLPSLLCCSVRMAFNGLTIITVDFSMIDKISNTNDFPYPVGKISKESLAYACFML